MSATTICNRTPQQKQPNTDCALVKKARRGEIDETVKGVVGQGVQPASLETTGPLPNEIFELLNEFWRPNELASTDQHLLNGKGTRRGSESPTDDQGDEEKEGEDDLTSIAEQDQDISQDRTTAKRRYSRLSDGYERLKSVLPSVKDKRRVSKARILDEAINYIQRLESITNVLKREHEKRLQMLNGGNGFFPEYGMQPYMRSIFPKQMYPQTLGGKMTPFTKMSGSTQSGAKQSARLKQPYQFSSSVGQTLPTNQMSPDYSTYQTLTTPYNNNNNSMYPSDPSQMMNGETSPMANTSPYSACSLSPGTPTSYQNGTVNNSWPYHQGSISSFNDSSSTQMIGHGQTRQPQTAYAGGTSYTTLSNGMWSGLGISDGSSQVVPHGTDHTMKVG